ALRLVGLPLVIAHFFSLRLGFALRAARKSTTVARIISRSVPSCPPRSVTIREPWQAYALPVGTPRQKHLVLILAREFASNLATPTLIADDRGWLLHYNTAAGRVF